LHGPNEARILALIAPGDRVLEVGGRSEPILRSTRGTGLVLTFPGESGATCREGRPTPDLVARDLCDREPWPFEDGSFDFCVCAQTLESLRDPLWVCREMIRVAKRGYVEVTSRLAESCRGQEPGVPVGFGDHRWLVEVNVPTIVFTPKSGLLHGDRRLSFPSWRAAILPEERRLSWLFWEEGFVYREAPCPGAEELLAFRRHPGEYAEFQAGLRQRLRRLSRRYPRLAAPVRRVIKAIA
jgi:Methyltransferase domain